VALLPPLLDELLFSLLELLPETPAPPLVEEFALELLLAPPTELPPEPPARPLLPGEELDVDVDVPPVPDVPELSEHPPAITPSITAIVETTD
jgi:hypothetical protein